ncbi:malonate decarboxylase holo-[acyl-carrier-protein] synthase [Tardiphaga robiniae]|uniref:Malonate decarboxylase holo-[acyl-carrier-protein] synthase n=1 Tax=Tardiphaga robiniae TaxID=943830 RepID=A0A7G6U1G5_9BRAD|nr:malonate decarboxylase holo-[acyl-carrier-protein] synthase [Tardiphaga robiniae]QND72847.1 malonate decarboxylase holo-[acyl-carrier-protein] synthase [Tardiphaga robiniae]
MTSHFNRNDRKLRRHDLIFVAPAAWRSLLQTRDDLRGEPLIVDWADRGWPLVLRRATPCEKDGLALGLPLPPFAGKRRISLLMRLEDIVAKAPPLELRAAMNVAPEPWRHTLEELASLASRRGVEARIFGSLAWRALTGLDYLSARSDLDFLLPLPREGDLACLTKRLAAIEVTAPMRLDGELVRDDGASVNWRELHTGEREVLVKTTDRVTLLDTNHFLSSRVLS